MLKGKGQDGAKKYTKGSSVVDGGGASARTAEKQGRRTGHFRGNAGGNGHRARSATGILSGRGDIEGEKNGFRGSKKTKKIELSFGVEQSLLD